MKNSKNEKENIEKVVRTMLEHKMTSNEGNAAKDLIEFQKGLAEFKTCEVRDFKLEPLEATKPVNESPKAKDKPSVGTLGFRGGRILSTLPRTLGAKIHPALMLENFPVFATCDLDDSARVACSIVPRSENLATLLELLKTMTPQEFERLTGHDQLLKIRMEKSPNSRSGVHGWGYGVGGWGRRTKNK